MDKYRLTPTPLHLVKPRLEWVGTVLGMDVYVDVSRQFEPEKKRDLAQTILEVRLRGEQHEQTNQNS